MNRIFVTEKQFGARLPGAYEIRDAILERIDTQIIPHYGWLPCFYLKFNIGSPISPHNNISNLGFILHTFMQLFDVREDGEYLSNWVDKQVRLAYDTSTPFKEHCVAIGHPWKDRFIFISDLMAVKNHTL